jgi:hypothetical protein
MFGRNNEYLLKIGRLIKTKISYLCHCVQADILNGLTAKCQGNRCPGIYQLQPEKYRWNAIGYHLQTGNKDRFLRISA